MQLRGTPPAPGEQGSGQLAAQSSPGEQRDGPAATSAAEAAPPRGLAVAHSNGAADVLLSALLRAGVPAVRAGRPATVAPSLRKRTAVALAERHPEVRSRPPGSPHAEA